MSQNPFDILNGMFGNEARRPPPTDRQHAAAEFRRLAAECRQLVLEIESSIEKGGWRNRAGGAP